MFAVTAVNVVGSFATAAALRAAAAGAAGQVALVRLAAQGAEGAFGWAGASTAADDGVGVIKPDSVAPASPGRWTLRALSDRNTDATGTHVLAVPWNGAEAVFRSSEGWQAIGASATHVYFARGMQEV